MHPLTVCCTGKCPYRGSQRHSLAQSKHASSSVHEGGPWQSALGRSLLVVCALASRPALHACSEGGATGAGASTTMAKKHAASSCSAAWHTTPTLGCCKPPGRLILSMHGWLRQHLQHRQHLQDRQHLQHLQQTQSLQSSRYSRGKQAYSCRHRPSAPRSPLCPRQRAVSLAGQMQVLFVRTLCNVGQILFAAVTAMLLIDTLACACWHCVQICRRFAGASST